MTFDQFEKKFTKKKKSNKTWYHFLCYLTLAFASFMLFSLLTDSFINFSGNRGFHICGFTFMIILATYGLVILRSKFKLTLWNNHLTKDKNIELLNFAVLSLAKNMIENTDNYFHFIYKKKWWQTPFEIYLFADQNLIAINVEGIDTNNGGFIDFGRSKKLREEILRLMREKASH